MKYPIPDLFPEERHHVVLDHGAALLGGFALAVADSLITEIQNLSTSSPFRHMETRGGKTMSVAMFSCGSLGWVSDRSGYRYDPVDPETGKPWPSLPTTFLELAGNAAAITGYPGFVPDACLVNRYVPGARLALHQDMDERDRQAPIVSVSLGLQATFLWGGRARTDKVRRHPLVHGDVVVWGGPSRMFFHGINALKEGEHPATGAVRYNLTFRKAA